MKIIFIVLFLPIMLFASDLQKAIDEAKPYAVIELSSGVFKGHFIVDKPLKIIGARGSNVIFDAGNIGSAVVLKSSHITLENITIRNTGHRKEISDSAIKGENIDDITIKKCHIYNALYGINLSMVNGCHIIANTISSVKEKIPLRGDGLKFWYVNDSHIVGNTFVKVRDIHLARSNHNIIKKNRFLDSRFATYIEFGKENIVTQNIYRYNETGVLLEGSQNIKIIHNQIFSSKGVVGIGIVLRGGGDIVVKNNTIKYNAKGLYVDAKPSREIKTKRVITENEISFNLEAIHFHAIISNNVLTFNKIHHNMEDIVKDITGNKNLNNKVAYNYWGQYRGFDRNHDNIGDTPYVIKRYFDKLYTYDNKIRFFYGSVVMALVDFMCEIAPFTKPEFILEDKKPNFLDLSDR